VTNHAWYQLSIVQPGGRRRGLARVEAKSIEHARQLGIDLGAEHHELRIKRLPSSVKRPLQRRFAECPHCQWLKENGIK
jgi:hypothetical protein